MAEQNPFEDLSRRAVEVEARANERRVAYVRLFAWFIATCVIGGYWATGRRTFGAFASMASMAALSGVLLYVVVRHYRSALSYLLPVVDVVMMTWLLGKRVEAVGQTPGMVATVCVICAFFASTGGLRLSRRVAGVMTLLAIIPVLNVVQSLGDRAPYVVLAIVATGIVSFWQTGHMRRLARGEQGRELLSRFLHPQVVSDAFQNPSTLRAPPRQCVATVMVTDLRKFTTIAERMDASAVVEMLNDVHGIAAEVVSRNGGSVDKFMGDGMLATFGAAEPLEQHAKKAIDAAQEMRARVRAINTLHPDRAPLRIGIGVHSGAVVSGVIGGGRKMEHTVIGDTVNIASRLESLTKEHGVDLLVSESATKDWPKEALRDLGSVALRGRGQALRVFTLAGARD